MKSFFIVIPPGLETLATSELEEKYQTIFGEAPRVQSTTHGGIEILASYEHGFALNYFLKIPTRILLRIDSYKCRDFPKLYKKFSSVDWNQYIRAGEFPQMFITTLKSRLINTKKMENTIVEAISKYYKKKTPPKLPPEYSENYQAPQIHVRVCDDSLTLSIDTSGERLDRRGMKSFTSGAPIRESFAYSLLWSARKYMQNLDGLSFLDPMCGSGTFLLEAAYFHTSNWNRDFSFESMPLIKGVEFIEKKFEIKGIPIFKNITGNDIDKEMIEKTKVINSITPENSNVSTQYADLFSDQLPEIKSSTDILLVNPPYGKRLKNRVGTAKYYAQLIKRIASFHHPKVFGVVFPKTEGPQPQDPDGYTKVFTTTFSNCGIKVDYSLFCQDQLK
ncbi:MAG: hypothetical protein HOE90_14410 [Bacteriovoracaceae bacterium]|jgi:putative N6-adenine-specific DNA methylase|nr:hypothetical protein [Bacteriovoracaceae bacterium]